jgi:hypothetical protein
MSSNKKRLHTNGEANSQEDFSRIDFMAEVFKLALLGIALYFLFKRADWSVVFFRDFWSASASGNDHSRLSLWKEIL